MAWATGRHALSIALAGLLAAAPVTASAAQATQAPAQPAMPPASGTAPASQAPPAPQTAAGTSPATPRTTPAQEPQPEPVVTEIEVERIRLRLEKGTSLKLNEQQLRFYVQILAKRPQFADFAKGYDWRNGPTKRGNPMTHQEFLAMVTPKEMYSSAGITSTDLLQFAITNWLGQALIKKALNDIGNARSERELRDIRDRIERELAALTRNGG